MKVLPMFGRLLRVTAVLAAPALLSACAAISAVNDIGKSLEVYELRPPASIATVRGRPLQRDVIVELPTTSGALETDRIMIRPNALQAQYLPGVRWSEETPVMVQTLMLRSVEATGAVRYVGRKPLGPGGDYALVTEVVDFQAEVADEAEAATVRIRMIVRVVRERDARIVASRTFEATAASASLETPDVVSAFDAAAGQAMTDFAAWLPGVVRG